MHSEMQSIIAATATGQMTFLTTEFGKPFTAAGFGNWFREQCNAVGLRHCSSHGLRKAAALAEVGCSEHEIAAITGHLSLYEVARYTRAADQERLAEAAIEKLEGAKKRTASV
jgi:integrase